MQVKLISLEANAEAQAQEVKVLQERHHATTMQEALSRGKATEMERRCEVLEKQLQELLLQTGSDKENGALKAKGGGDSMGLEVEAKAELEATRVERDDLSSRLQQAQSRIAQMEVS